jgi:hypothetical protein
VLAIAGLRLNDPVSATAGPLLLALGTALLLGMWPFSGDPGPASADSDSAQLQSALWLALLAAPLLTGVEGLREGLRATGMEQATAAALAVIGALNLGAAAVWPAIDRRWGSVWAAAWWGDSGLAVLGLAAGTEPALRGALLLLVLQMVPRVLLAWPAGGAWRRAALLAGAGLPLTAAFAARLYVLEQLSPLGAGMLAFAVIASTVAGAWQTWAAISGPAPALPRGQEMQRWLGAATLAGSAAVGLVPRLAGALLGIR